MLIPSRIWFTPQVQSIMPKRCKRPLSTIWLPIWPVKGRARESVQPCSDPTLEESVEERVAVTAPSGVTLPVRVGDSTQGTLVPRMNVTVPVKFPAVSLLTVQLAVQTLAATITLAPWVTTIVTVPVHCPTRLG